MTLSPADKLYAKLAAAQAEEARGIAEQQKALEQSKAKARDLDKQLREARRMVVGTLAENAGLLPDERLVFTPEETATLAQGFTLLAHLLRRGALAKVLAEVHAWDTWEADERQALLNGDATLIVTNDAGEPLGH